MKDSLWSHRGEIRARSSGQTTVGVNASHIVYRHRRLTQRFDTARLHERLGKEASSAGTAVLVFEEYPSLGGHLERSKDRRVVLRADHG